MRYFSRIFIVAFLLLSADSILVAGTITGQLQFPSAGQGIRNNTVTFTLTQPAVVAGTATVVTAPWNCWTDTSGNLVGLPGDAAIAAPALTSNLVTGSLASGTYFVKYTWKNGTGESQASAERNLVLPHSGTLIVQAPAIVPAAATSMQVYIGTSPNGETLQGSVAVTGGVLAGNYSQSSSLVNGPTLPSSNTSTCSIRFNDELTPSYTGYNVALFNASGAEIQGFRQKWYLAGGISGTINLANGTPLYAGTVVYPQSVVTSPAANGQQSINGPLNLNGFGLTAGSVSAGSGAVSNPGVFTDTQMNAYLTSLVNGIVPATEFQVEQGAHNATEAITAGIAFPMGSTVYQGNVIAGYAKTLSTTTNVVAGYFQTRIGINSGKGWGVNPVFDDGNFSSTTGAALEADCNINNPGTAGGCIQVNGAFSGSPTSFPGIQIANPVGGGKWTAGFLTSTGATNIALYVNPVGSGVGQNSQEIQLSGDAGIVAMRATSAGSYEVKPASGKGMSVSRDSYVDPRGLLECATDGTVTQALSTAVTKGCNISDGGGVTMVMGVNDSTVHPFIQGRDNAGDSVSRAIEINPLGGAVLIGTATSSGALVDINGITRSSTYSTASNCSGVGTSASPSVVSCGSAAAGSFSCATAATGAMCTVNTTAVTASSQIFVQEDETLGAKLGVTCNTSTNVLPASRLLNSRLAGTSFTINLGTVTTNPACFSYFIVN